MLTLKVVQAKYGDCFILIFGREEAPKYILIDGGPEGIYNNYLKSELKKIKDAEGQLELVILSHIDGDHIVGLLDLTEEMKISAIDREEPIIQIKEMWMNSFSQAISNGSNLKIALQSMLTHVNNIASTLPSGNKAVQSILQGDTLRRNALLLNIPLNKITNSEIISYDNIQEPITIDNIKITIIGPSQENLNKLRDEWHKWIRKNESKVLTTDRELQQEMDRSVPNLSSIMFLLESEGKSMLFTGDGRGDFIMEGLEKVGLLDNKGTRHVNVFKVPHHGSIRNTNRDFFKRVTADKYVISADGRHNNPDFETLSSIVSCAQEQGRAIEVICTNRTEATERLEKEFPVTAFSYTLVYMPKEKHCLDITG